MFVYLGIYYHYYYYFMIDVWGFDDAAVNALQNMKPMGMPELVKKYAVLLNDDSELLADSGLHQTGMMDNQVSLLKALDTFGNRPIH